MTDPDPTPDEPENCPICGDPYDERHEVKDPEYYDVKGVGNLMAKLTDDVHMVEVEDRLLVFYVHDSHLSIPESLQADTDQ